MSETRQRRFSEKVVVVTGASSGIGAASARAFAAEGAAVALAARTEDALEDLAAEIRRTGGRAIAVPTDVSDARSALALLERVANELGGIDVLVNNAGANHRGPVEDRSFEELSPLARRARSISRRSHVLRDQIRPSCLQLRARRGTGEHGNSRLRRISRAGGHGIHHERPRACPRCGLFPTDEHGGGNRRPGARFGARWRTRADAVAGVEGHDQRWLPLSRAATPADAPSGTHGTRCEGTLSTSRKEQNYGLGGRIVVRVKSLSQKQHSTTTGQ